jgi:hypothetical protein
VRQVAEPLAVVAAAAAASAAASALAAQPPHDADKVPRAADAADVESVEDVGGLVRQVAIKEEGRRWVSGACEDGRGGVALDLPYRKLDMVVVLYT